MILSKHLWRTYKEVPASAEIPSHALMLRAGLIHQSASGIYNYLPLAQRAIRKVEQIVREEMDKLASEVCMSVVTPSNLWQESGRWETMAQGADRVMLVARDKRERELCLSPSNEEVVVDIFKGMVQSYKDLPMALYQINTKFRDEIRPRFGLLRGREFTMKDAYSFHESQDNLDRIYQDFFQSYAQIFKRLGLTVRAVEADAGCMGDAGATTHEFQAIADNGEDQIVYSPRGNFSANIEMAKTRRKKLSFAPPAPLEEVATKGMDTIEKVCNFLNVPLHHSLKSLVYMVQDGEKEKEYPVLVQLLGDDTLNETKLRGVLSGQKIYLAKDEQLLELGLVKGYIGGQDNPLGKGGKIILDSQIDTSASYTAGANKVDYHCKGLVPERDITGFTVADVRVAKEGDLTLGENGQGEEQEVKICRGIEVGHIFHLGGQIH